MYPPRLVSGDERSVVRFICDQDVLNGPPTLAATNGNTYEFEFRTSLACLPRVVDCRLLGADGLEYDLSSLRRTDADWQVRDRSGRCVCLGVSLAACSADAGVVVVAKFHLSILFLLLVCTGTCVSYCFANCLSCLKCLLYSPGGGS